MSADLNNPEDVSGLKPNQVDAHRLVAHPVTPEFPDWDYDIVHPATCPQKDMGGYWAYDCAEASVEDFAIDQMLENITKPGTYRYEYWVEHTPSGPWGGEEWDNGLNFLDTDDKGNGMRLEDLDATTELGTSQ